jgi:cellulose synthase/poly-beta-1,6-N-acetylglucosamine synthase-like glycosyltransferase
MSALFWLSLALLVYTWTVYPSILYFLRKVFTREVRRGELAVMPFVSVIVAVHNEQQQIGAKLDDCFRWNYPSDLVEFIVVSDGSTDQTEGLVEHLASREPRLRLLRSARVGKSSAQNLAVQHARGEILLFTDAGTRTKPDLLNLLMQNFADSHVGLAAATIHFGSPDDAVSKGQGLYWRYENFLRRAESDLGILSTVGGSAMAMRKEAFRPLPNSCGDDCIFPLDVRLQGHRVVIDPRAVVFDTLPHSIHGELRARVRMTSRNWTGTLSRRGLLNPFRFPATSWGILSHKLLRWLTPFLLVFLFLANTTLALHGRFVLFCLLQSVFYVAAIIGWVRLKNGQAAWALSYPFAFCLANLGFLLGMWKVFRNQKVVTY